MREGFSKILVAFFLCAGFSAQAQMINEGRIVFERRTNLEKRFSGDARVKRWLGDNKAKIDEFELLFNDSLSIFRPIESDEVDNMKWATSRSTVMQDFAKEEKILVLDVVGQQVYVKDSNDVRAWKITESKRTIGNYKCRKAIYEKNDSTRIYAWYAMEVVPSIGPEGFCGLPGAIMGLATEDGGIIYFAKEVKAQKIDLKEFVVDLKKKDVYTTASLKAELEKRFGNQPWGKRLYDDLFRWL
jgi:GLPGLI family protein